MNKSIRTKYLPFKCSPAESPCFPKTLSIKGNRVKPHSERAWSKAQEGMLILPNHHLSYPGGRAAGFSAKLFFLLRTQKMSISFTPSY